jgi:hypothetical protein
MVLMMMSPTAKHIYLYRVGHGQLLAASLPSGMIHIRDSHQFSSVSGKSSPFSDSASWDTDFSDDENTGKVSDMDRSQLSATDI